MQNAKDECVRLSSAKIGADTAENERSFAEHLQLPYEDRDPRAAQGRRPDGGDGASAARASPSSCRRLS